MLPLHFQFSQGSLQDFVDCPRRFQLKYIEQLAWPAAEAEPALENERHLQLGATFHRMAQQYLLGIPAEKLAPLAARDPDLARWWENFLRYAETLGTFNRAELARYPEISLSAPLGEHRLTGKFDLLTRAGDRFTIYDWKTARKKPKRQWLAEKLQTRVYPWLLVQAGARFNGGKPVRPEQIEMVYWFAEFPAAPMRFPYSRMQFEEDDAYLHALLAEIEALDDTPAPLTDNEKRCRFCVYRSLCDRGLSAGPLDELEDPEAADAFDFTLDFEQIAEIEF
jgi:predicted RecB family nuclease